MWLAVIIIIAAVAIGVALGLNQAKKNKDLQEKGIIVDRRTGFAEAPFYEQEELFTLHGDWETVWGALRTADYHGAISSGTKQQGLCLVDYEGTKFKAQFRKLKTEEGQPQQYAFKFTSWESNRGTPVSGNAMNALLTTVEKTLLSIDPNTQVSSERLNFNTKAKFF